LEHWATNMLLLIGHWRADMYSTCMFLSLPPVQLTSAGIMPSFCAIATKLGTTWAILVWTRRVCYRHDHQSTVGRDLATVTWGGPTTPSCHTTRWVVSLRIQSTLFWGNSGMDRVRHCVQWITGVDRVCGLYGGQFDTAGTVSSSVVRDEFSHRVSKIETEGCDSIPLVRSYE
jgi:hypothetical protein